MRSTALVTLLVEAPKNGLVQAAKRRARGYRTTSYMRLVVYLIAGKLDLQSTH